MGVRVTQHRQWKGLSESRVPFLDGCTSEQVCVAMRFTVSLQEIAPIGMIVVIYFFTMGNSQDTGQPHCCWPGPGPAGSTGVSPVGSALGSPGEEFGAKSSGTGMHSTWLSLPGYVGFPMILD